jgi:hypothetical protein
MFKKIMLISLLTITFSSCTNSTESEKPITNEPSRTTAEDSKETVDEERKMGENIVLQNLTFKINSFRETNVLTARYSSPKQARQGAKFVVVDFDVTNTTTTSFTPDLNESLRLIDNKEREFKVYNDMIGNIDNYFAWRELAPSLSENGVVVYEIPTDAEQYILTVFEQDLSKIYVVKLKEKDEPQPANNIQK